ncbi:hypothetical protein C3F09_03615 [candidate division GN15 bacterium]|uniref:Lipoprotein n=1 Tax=candidate division GN15 bacterium TaxID=2072418 RepID=A0A855X2Y4_9BACT|nr:MAG: hypothetical protein C3F09_03615 [candidate division GN15 bacterium]
MNAGPMRTIVRLTALVVAGMLASCASRYNLVLNVTESGQMRHVKVDQTQFAPGTVLGDPASEAQLRSGQGSCVIVLASVGTKQQSPSGGYDVLRYDEILRYRVFLQLPPTPIVGRWPLENRSFAEIMGRYELRKDETLFTIGTGTVAVDSLARNRAYMSINGEFRNGSGAVLAVDGQFKVRIK